MKDTQSLYALWEKTHPDEDVVNPYKYIVGLRTHDEENCAGPYCCIHNPSDNHMSGWYLIWRPDRYLMERQCPHGVGHPDIDDMAYRKSKGDTDNTHGCDGCCESPNGFLKWN